MDYDEAVPDLDGEFEEEEANGGAEVAEDPAGHEVEVAGVPEVGAAPINEVPVEVELHEGPHPEQPMAADQDIPDIDVENLGPINLVVPNAAANAAEEMGNQDERGMGDGEEEKFL